MTNTARLRYADVYSSDDSNASDYIPLSKYKKKYTQEFHEDMYVVVKLAGKKIIRHYVALIISIDESSEMTVKFMKKTGNHSFIFPDVDDISVIDETDIQKILSNPKYKEKNDEYYFSEDLNSFSNLF